MKQLLFAFFPKKEKPSTDLIPKGVKIVYPFDGYEQLNLRERFKVIGENIMENKMVMKKI